MRYILAAVAFFLAAGAAEAQTHTLTPTTLTVAMNATQQYVQVASAAGITRTGAIYVDRELLRVKFSYNGTSLTVPVFRGSIYTPHASGAAAISGEPAWFQSTNISGGCTLALTFASPWVNIINGNQYLCTAGAWVLQGSGGSSVGSSVQKGNGAGAFAAATAPDVVGLFGGCSGTEPLGADGNCHASAGGPNLITLSITGGSLTIGGVNTACSSGTPCFASVGNGNPITYTNNSTGAPAAGSDTWYVWIDKNGTRSVGYSVVAPTCTNCTAVPAITSAQTGSGGISLGSVTVVSGVVTAVSPTIPVQSAPLNVICGTNLTCTPAGTGVTLDAAGSSPAGLTKELQYNNAGAFGAVGSSDVSGTNFIIPRNGTFGANGRSIVGQNGGGDAVHSTADHFGNSFVVTTEPNAVGEAIMRFGPLATTGNVFWLRGGLQLIQNGSQYTCDSTTRGMFFVTDSAAGVKDKVEVCAKDAGDAYAWRTIY